MRLATGTDPAQTRGRAASAHEQWEGHPKYMLASHVARSTAATPLTLLKSALSDPTLPVSSMSPCLPSLHPKKLLRSPFNETNVNVVI